MVRAALDDPTASDLDLINQAIEQERILITEDSDFTDLIFARGHSAPPSLIYIRCEPSEQTEIANQVLEIIENDELMGQVAVVTTKQVRYRPFPVAND